MDCGRKGREVILWFLYSIDENQVNVVDNKKWEFSVSITEFEDLIDLENWKYVLLADTNVNVTKNRN